MAKTSNLNMRIDPALREQAEEIFKSLGFTVTTAVNMFLAKSIMENGLPFEVKQPRYNAETEAAMEDARQIVSKIKNGEKVKTYSSASEMFKAIGV